MSTQPKRYIVTGGASGLGATVVKRFVERGDQVVIVDRQQTSEVPTVVVDMLDVPAIGPAIEQAIEQLGGLDGILVSAGINAPGPTETLDPAAIDRVISINATGSILSVKAALPALVESKGRAVFVGSTLSLRGNDGQVSYAASKHAVLGALRALGHEYRGRVGLGIVMPGAMDTAFFDNRPDKYLPVDGTRVDPQTVGDAIVFMFDQPDGIAVRELLITHYGVGDWP